MRNLTIKRTKSFVGCLGKIKVYIEDPASNEITINHTACRKIGDLKNGEEKTFQIEEHAAKVFVIADTLSKDYCNEYYQLSDGQEDIFLSGKNRFNPANGNAFQFDNNKSKEIVINRKLGTRKGLIVLLSCIVVGLILGQWFIPDLFSDKTPKMKTFSADKMTITLTDEFRKTNMENFTVVYDSKAVAVFALKEEFILVDGFADYTLEQYADLVIQANNLSSVQIKTVDGLTGFQYDVTKSETNETYRFFTYVYKTNDAFWCVQFATQTKNVEAYESQITQWAKSIAFSN